MFKATQAIYEALSSNSNLKVFTEEREKSSDVWLQFGIKNGGSYRIRFISNDNDNDVAVRVYTFASVDPEQILKVLPVINELNSKYRYVKFVVDSDGDIHVEYDFPQSCAAPEESAEELVIRIVKIIDDAYPAIMRAIWS